jgi:hypothetical protein
MTEMGNPDHGRVATGPPARPARRRRPRQAGTAGARPLAVCGDVHGLRVGFRTNARSVLDHLAAHPPVGWQPMSAGSPVNHWYGVSRRAAGPDGRAVHVLERAGRHLWQSDEFHDAWQQFEYQLEIDVAEHSPRYVFVHAGVVGWKDRAVLIPGRTCSGKSTLVAALCRAGADYYSDEYALLDHAGRVHPYARPLRLRDAARDVPPSTPPRAAGAAPPLTVGLVVLTHFDRDASWEPTPLTRSLAVLDMLNHALSVQRQPQVVLEVLGRAMAGARALRGPRGDAAATAERILRSAVRAVTSAGAARRRRRLYWREGP